MFILQSQAKVEQELSIAKRIICAQDVEIEEFYDLSGSGNIGLNNTQEKFSLGVSGDGRKVVKRVIKFKGFNEKFIQDLKDDKK